MNLSLQKFAFILMLGGILLSACTGANVAVPNSATSTPLALTTTREAVIAEGRIVPRKSVELSFASGGKVAEILVKEGDFVKTGDVLARLDNQEQIKLSLAEAELEIVHAQQALNDLQKTLGVNREDMLQAVSEANKALKEAKYDLYNFKAPPAIAQYEVLKAIEVATARLEAAKKAFEPYKARSSGDSTRKELKEALDNAQSDYNAAVRWLALSTKVAWAQIHLDQATRDYDELLQGPKATDIASAEARLAAAKAGLEAAKAAGDKIDLKAPISGMLVEQDLTVGQPVIPSQPVMKLADLAQLFVETTDLTEIQVVNIKEGQKAKIVADALPGVEMSGTVEKIKQVFEDKSGDITYTVRIKLDENADPRLLWGMTVVVTFEE